MIRTILGGAAGVIAAPAVGGLAYRKARQRRVAKALEITAPNGIVEQRFVRVGGIDQWIQLGGEDRDNPVLLVHDTRPTKCDQQQPGTSAHNGDLECGCPSPRRKQTSTARSVVWGRPES